MLSLLVPSGYESCNIAEKIQNPRLIVGYVFFSAMIITRMIHQREQFYCLGNQNSLIYY